MAMYGIYSRKHMTFTTFPVGTCANLKFLMHTESAHTLSKCYNYLSFRYTFVKDNSTFWAGLYTDPILESMQACYIVQ